LLTIDRNLIIGSFSENLNEWGNGQVKRINRTRSIGIFAWAAFLALALAGCAGIGQSLQAPDIRLAGLLVEEVDLFETILQLKLRVINGNDIPLVLKGIQCELELNDKSVATGVSKTPVNIPALGSDTVSVRVYSSMFNIASTFFRMVQNETAKTGTPDFTYKLSGRIHLETSGLTPSTIPFKTTGKISLENTFGKIVE
jgi:LEA14-like dessication related protein